MPPKSVQAAITSISQKPEILLPTPLRTIALPCFPVRMVTRAFTDTERQFLEKVAKRLPQEAGERLRSDMSVASVVQAGDFLQVDLQGYERPEYAGHRNLPVEGKLRDARGGAVTLLVNVDQNERLLEIEIIWWDNDSGTELHWSTLQIVSADRSTW